MYGEEARLPFAFLFLKRANLFDDQDELFDGERSFLSDKYWIKVQGATTFHTDMPDHFSSKSDDALLWGFILFKFDRHQDSFCKCNLQYFKKYVKYLCLKIK